MMAWTVTIAGTRYAVAMHEARSLARVLVPGRTPSLAFNLPASTIETLRRPEQGRGVWCQRLTLTPHGDGTHTESAAHLLGDATAAPPPLPLQPCLARLVSVGTRLLGQSQDPYRGHFPDEDRIVDGGDLMRAFAEADGMADLDVEGLIVRVGAGEEHAGTAYLGLDAVARLAATSVKHLVVNLPSIDRMDDGGALKSHALFFGVDDERRASSRPEHTITELADIPLDVPDGLYLLWLSGPEIVTDAVPSRPVVMPLVKVDAHV